MPCLSSPHVWNAMISRCTEVKCGFWAALVLGAVVGPSECGGCGTTEAGDEMPRPRPALKKGTWDRSTITKEAVQRFHASVRARMAGGAVDFSRSLAV